MTRIDHEGVEIDGGSVAARTTFWAAGVAASEPPSGDGEGDGERFTRHDRWPPVVRAAARGG